MTSFTVTVCNQSSCYRQEFDRDAFTSMFPNSLITATLELCGQVGGATCRMDESSIGENDVPLENPSVTPEVLALLNELSLTRKYSAVDARYKKALDYLGIDLPEPVYYPQYAKILGDLPDFDVNDFKNYAAYFQLARDYRFPELASYLFSQTDPFKYKQQDNIAFTALANELKTHPETSLSRILILLLTKRKIIGAPRPDDRPLAYTVVDTLDPELFTAYLKLVPGAPETYAIVSHIVTQMIRDPENYLRYYAQLMVLGPYLASSSRVALPVDELLDLTGMLQGPIYDLIRAASTGDVKTVNKLFDPTGALKELDLEFGPVAAYTALITRHYALARDIFLLTRNHLEEIYNTEYEDDYHVNYDEITQASEALTQAADPWVGKILDAYLSQPKWMTTEGFQVVLDGLRSFSDIDPDGPDYPGYAVQRLGGSGRTDLIKVFPSP